MDIIKAVDGSVIWLLEDNAAATRNLKALANAHAVDPARLVFAGRVDSSKHIARHRLADLFLDTLPYNAHTTASDALWAGLPMLTVRGSTFPGRVGASLLNGVGLAELIMDDVGQYRENAIRLGCCPEEILRLRRKLADNKRGSSLFDTVGRTRQLETAYFEMWSRHKMGLAPDHFSIGAP